MGAKELRVEQAFIITICLISVWIYNSSYSYPADIKLFPQITAGFVIITGLSILISNKLLLDGNSNNYWISNVNREVLVENSFEAVTSRENLDKNNLDIKEIYLLGLVGMYAVSGFLFGLFWVTPLFVSVYARWNGLIFKQILVLAVISLLIPFAIMYYLNIDYMTGYIQRVLI